MLSSDESKANEPTGKGRMGPNTIDGMLLCWRLGGGRAGGGWGGSGGVRRRGRRLVVVVVVVLERSNAGQDVIRLRIHDSAAGSRFAAFFQVIPNGETRAREEHQPLQREQACRTTARNYFGDNLPVSILWGRFGRPLSSKSRGPPAISTRAGTHSQALSSLRGNVPAFDPS